MTCRSSILWNIQLESESAGSGCALTGRGLRPGRSAPRREERKTQTPRLLKTFSAQNFKWKKILVCLESEGVIVPFYHSRLTYSFAQVDIQNICSVCSECLLIYQSLSELQQQKKSVRVVMLVFFTDTQYITGLNIMWPNLTLLCEGEFYALH